MSSVQVTIRPNDTLQLNLIILLLLPFDPENHTGMSEFDHKVYGLNRQARCLTSVANINGNSEFLVGTVGLDQNNKIHRILIDDETNSQFAQVFDYKDEIYGIESCSWDPKL
ncbi:hypothetical protein BB560_006599, partial [Smittium megazygosporum]